MLPEEDLNESIKQGGIIINERPRLFFVPDEICIIAPGDQREHYDQTRDALNQAIWSNYEAAPALVESWEGLGRDLLPTGPFGAYLEQRRNEALLSSAEKIEDQVLVLPSHADYAVEATTFAFYKVDLKDFEPDVSHLGEVPLSDSGRTLLGQQQGLSQLVNLLNIPLLLPRREDAPNYYQQKYDVAISGITPNWGFAAQHFCPGPGSLPVPISPAELQSELDARASSLPGKWTFRFTFQEKLGEEKPTVAERATVPTIPDEQPPIAVAILDTCPDQIDLDWGRDTYRDNVLMQQVVGSATPFDDAISVRGELLQAYDNLNLRVNLRNQLVGSAKDIRLADHGLFIAGIIHDIAPHAEIHLGRVLNGFGISSLRGVVEALQKLPARFPGVFGGPGGDNPSSARRLIVNLSLGASLPPGEELIRLWLTATDAELRANPATATKLEEKTDVLSALTDVARPEVQAYLLILRSSVQAILDWLDRYPRVLVIGAAGNDNDFLDPYLTGFDRPEPRWPAHYDPAPGASPSRQSRAHSVGVAAVNRVGDGAEYSNRGDVDPLGNGIAVWGGDSHHPTGSYLGMIPFPGGSTWTPSDVDAIKGIYSAEALPSPTGVEYNETGWAYWSGTSFATPIIAGLAANLWASRIDDQPGQIIDHIVHDLPIGPSKTDPNGLFAPVIRAYQEWEQR